MTRSTVRRAPSSQRSGPVLIVGGLFALIAAVLIFSLVVGIASDPEVKANLGDARFAVGEAARLAAAIDAGGPILFQDPLEQGGDGLGRDVYVEHRGTDPEAGWSAVLVRSRNSGCVLRLNRGEQDYRRPCPGNPRYPASVENGIVIIDLRPPGTR